MVLPKGLNEDRFIVRNHEELSSKVTESNKEVTISEHDEFPDESPFCRILYKFLRVFLPWKVPRGTEAGVEKNHDSCRARNYRYPRGHHNSKNLVSWYLTTKVEINIRYI